MQYIRHSNIIINGCYLQCQFSEGLKKSRLYYIISGWQAEGMPLYVNRICPQTKSPLFAPMATLGTSISEWEIEGEIERWRRESIKGGAAADRECLCMCVWGSVRRRRCVFPMLLYKFVLLFWLLDVQMENIFVKWDHSSTSIRVRIIIRLSLKEQVRTNGLLRLYVNI